MHVLLIHAYAHTLACICNKHLSHVQMYTRKYIYVHIVVLRRFLAVSELPLPGLWQDPHDLTALETAIS